MDKNEAAVENINVEQRVLRIRGQNVLLDRDLAELYGVQTKALKQAVRRNTQRFPSDFMFVLTPQEVAHLRSQSVTSNQRTHGGARYAPMAFTEQGVAMLSSVLNSERAIDVNIAIMRTFVRLRQFLRDHAELAHRLDELEKKYDEQFSIVFDAIRALMEPPEKDRTELGFHV